MQIGISYIDYLTLLSHFDIITTPLTYLLSL